MVKVLCVVPSITVNIIICLITDWAVPRMNANTHHGLWVTVMCQCGFISYNTGTTLMGMLITGEMCGEGQGVNGKSLYLPLNFAMTLKLLKNFFKKDL